MEDNRQIIDNFRKGDSNTIIEFYKHTVPNLKTFIIKRGGNIEDAEDVFQDGCMKFLEQCHNPNFLPKGSVYAFFYTICIHAYLDSLRKKKLKTDRFDVMGSKIDFLIADENANPEYQLFLKDNQSIVLDALKKLDSQCQELITLHYSHGLTYKEISEITEMSEISGVKPGTLRKRTLGCKKRLIIALRKNEAVLIANNPFVLKFLRQIKHS